MLTCLARWQVGVLSMTLLLDMTLAMSQMSSRFPSIALDYTLEVGPGKEDCFHQYIMGGSILYLHFQVIKGGDGKAGFKVVEPNGTVVLPYSWETENSYDTEAAMDGEYTFCIDNSVSRFATKKVVIYLHSFYAEDSEQYMKEIGEMELTAANFTKVLSAVGTHLSDVTRIMHHLRSDESRDMAFLQGSVDTVTFWSLVQVIIIIATGLGSAYYIKQLFDTPHPSSGRLHLYPKEAITHNVVYN